MLLWEDRENVFVVEHDNQNNIRIEKTLSDKFQQAFVWMDAHTNIVKQAHAFVTMLNSTNLLTQPVQVLRELGHFKPLSNLDVNIPPDNEVLSFFTNDIHPNNFLGIRACSHEFLVHMIAQRRQTAERKDAWRLA